MNNLTPVGIGKNYKNELNLLLSDVSFSLYLYGSCARGDAKVTSDIDFLCVIKEPFAYGELIQKTSEITSRLSLETDRVISRIFVSEQSFNNSNIPFIKNVRQDAIPI
jgi:predicted nucleotidyltransferase